MRLPRLTLFTSGPQCSLCVIAKADLTLLQSIAPFHLTLFDIRKQSTDSLVLAKERTTWRRLYQYDVPVLHYSTDQSLASLAGRQEEEGRGGGRVMKHRIDKEKLVHLVQRWTKELNQ